MAKIYAQAFLGAAEKSGQTDALVVELSSLVRDVLSHSGEFEAVLASALVSADEKSALLDRVFASRVSPLLLDFLKVISRHGRLDVLRAIDREVEKLHDQLRGRVRVRVETATPLDDGLAHRLAGSLGHLLGGQPELENAVDPRLIGGVVLRVGDTVYDGSVARQLAQVRQQMINRSVHEIQSRRDRVRHPGGN